MTRGMDAAAALAFVALAASFADSAAARWIHGNVEILAGHVFRISDVVVRLNGVDAPVRDQRCYDQRGDAYNCASHVRAAVRDRWGRASVKCLLVEHDAWREEPQAATCYHGSQNINAAVVALGLGIADRSETMRYVRYERYARQQGHNLWSGRFMAPRIWREGTDSAGYPY